MSSKLAPIRIQAGKWTVLDNHVRVNEEFGSIWQDGRNSSVEAFWNILGTGNRKPTRAGAIGDVCFFPKMHQTDPMGWLCVAPGIRGDAEWREIVTGPSFRAAGLEPLAPIVGKKE